MFKSESLEFLKKIEQNNNKEWFEAHRDEYEKHILNPSRLFVEEMGEHLMALEPTINYAPKINHSLFKIYRDIRRMGSNKLPLKTRIGFVFWQGGGKRLQSSSFYLHFSPYELFVSVGVRWFEKPMLEAYRETIKDEQKRDELQKIIDEIMSKGYKLLDKSYKRYPKGFKDVELSLYKGMATYTVLDPKIVTDENKLIDTLYKIYEDMLPMQQFMYEVSLKA